MEEGKDLSSFKMIISNTVNRALSSVFVNKTMFCDSKTKLNPLILSGTSASGKGTLFDMLSKRNPNMFELSVSCTTRKARNNEQHGVHYYFVSQDEFEQNISKNLFVEHCLVHNKYYGTLTSQVQSFIDNGKICVLDIDVQGAQKIHQKFPNWNYVFINLPSIQVQEQRLRQRGTDSEEQIQIRLKNSKIEIDLKNKLGFYHNITNDIKEQTYSDLLSHLHKVYPIKFN